MGGITSLRLRAVLSWLMTLRLTLVLSLLVAACSGAEPIPVTDFQAAYEHAWCERFERCGLVADATTCEAGTIFDSGQMLASVAAGRTAYDADAARACVDAVASGDCDFARLDACVSVVTGQGDVGDACFIDFDCASDRCVLDAGCTEACCAGTCAARAAVGASCVSSTECGEGLTCALLPDGSAATCQERPTSGQPCSFPGQCAPGDFCQLTFLPTDGYGPGVCVTRAAHGEACDGSFPRDACAAYDDFCDPASSRCTSRGSDGDACRGLASGIALAGDSCRLGARCVDGACVAWPAGTGAVCTDGCEVGYACGAAGTCAPEDRAPACE